MWYFTWILGIGFAVAAAIVNALGLEFDDEKNGSDTPT